VGALRENQGLVELNLSDGCFRENDETWGALCDSLKTHPTLEVLNLSTELTFATKTPAVVTSRIQALLDVVQVNISIHTIRLCRRYSEDALFRGSVIPYLETNRLRPRLLAIQKTRPILYRAKVLGRALRAARTDPESFWMLISGNAEVVFPSTTATATPAATLPTPAAATATANVPATTADAATSAATSSTDTTSGVFDPTVSAAANVATTSAGQKRKGRL
jgi:hypothetical protein